jgi:hypothetical protein
MGEAAGLLHESGSCQAVRVGGDVFAVAAVGRFVREGEEGDGDVGGAVVAEAGEAGADFVGNGPREEIAVVGATIALDEGHPGAGVGFKCGELGEVEGVVDLAGYGLAGGHGVPSLVPVWHEGEAGRILG